MTIASAVDIQIYRLRVQNASCWILSDGLQASPVLNVVLVTLREMSQKEQTACPICLAGKFAADINGNPTNRSGIHCMNCSAGSYSIEASSSCQACGEGHYSAFEGLSVCEDCEIGRYSNLPIASECQLCSAGSYQDGLQATSCIECSLGHASGNVTGRTTACPICLAGKFACGYQREPNQQKWCTLYELFERFLLYRGLLELSSMW